MKNKNKLLLNKNNILKADRRYLYVLLDSDIYKTIELNEEQEFIKIINMSDKEYIVSELNDIPDVDFVDDLKLIELITTNHVNSGGHIVFDQIKFDYYVIESFKNSLKSNIEFDNYMIDNELTIDKDLNIMFANGLIKNKQDIIKNAKNLYLKTSFEITLPFTCSICGKRIPFTLNSKDRTIKINENHYGYKDKDCYKQNESDYVSICLTGESGKFIVMNDLRGAIENISDDDFRQMFGMLDSVKSTDDAIRKFAEKDILVNYVGNNSLMVIPIENGLVLANEKGLNDNDVARIEKDRIGTVTCDLWWFMATAIENVNIDTVEKSGFEYFIIDTGIKNMKIHFYFNKANQSEDFTEIKYKV